jgi:hypothetical protein
MKKIVLLVFGLFLGLTSFAQIRAGAGVVFATEVNTVGIQATGVYEITEKWEGAAAFTYFFEKDFVNWKVLDLDGHYVFYSLDKFNFYGLAGLSLDFWKVKIPAISMMGYVLTPETTSTGTSAGFNIGAGAKYNISEKLSVVPELRFTIMDGSYLRFGVTAQYKF